MKVQVFDRWRPLVSPFIILVSLLAIERLGGTVPQGDHNRQRGIGLAYHKLHVLTGSQGDLVRERCLQRGE